MRSRAFIGRRIILLALSLCAIGVLPSPLTALAQPTASAQQALVIKTEAEKKVKQLPAGPWYWLIESFPTLAAAQGAEGPTSLSAQVADKGWLFTLGAKGQPTHGGTKVAEVGPVATFSAPEYLLRINSAGGPPGSKTPVHMHPGFETFYVLSGEFTLRTADGVSHVEASRFMTGHAPDTAMQVSSTGAGDLSALVLFVVDGTKPFSSPAKLE